MKCKCSEVVPVVSDGEDKGKSTDKSEDTSPQPKKGPPKVVVDLTLSDESEDEGGPTPATTNGPAKLDSTKSAGRDINNCNLRVLKALKFVDFCRFISFS